MSLSDEVLARIRALGGDTSLVTGESLAADLQAITFDTVLYEAPVDTPWASAEETEPIPGLSAFLEARVEHPGTAPDAVLQEMIAHHYRPTEEAYGQDFWVGKLFTPFREGTDDHAEWYEDWFADLDDDALEPIITATGDERPDFVQIVHSYGFPDHLYVCLSDPDPSNPTVWGTDHEVFFQEIEPQGSLLEWLQARMTPQELIAIVRRADWWSERIG